MTTPVGEFGWIERLVAALGAGAPGAGDRQAIGDDAAILEGPGGETWVWTVDGLVEGVHFRFDWLDDEDVGHRALAASLSDLAAMGAEPRGALVSVAGPRGAIEGRLEGVYRGLGGLAVAAACPILGGDLSRAEGPLHLAVTALGRCARAPLERSGARPGDDLWVTGALGAPAAALALLEARGPTPAVRAHPAYERLARPGARVAEARWLLERAPLHAAIDVSDGVSSDAGHLASRSEVAITIEAERIPVHPSAEAVARELGAVPLDWALHGGEEFELLVAAPAGTLDPLAAPFAERFGIALVRIGTIEAGSGVTLARGGARLPLPPGGWDHFRRR